MGVHVVETMPGKFTKGGRKKRRAAAEAAEAARLTASQGSVRAPAAAPHTASARSAELGNESNHAGLNVIESPCPSFEVMDDFPPDEEAESESFR